MASSYNRRGGNSRPEQHRTDPQQNPNEPQQHYPQQPSFMQVVGNSAQFGNPQYPPYGYGYTQDVQPGIPQQSGNYATNVPRSPLRQPYPQAMQNAMFAMPQSSPTQQYNHYAPIGSASQRSGGIPGSAVTQPSYYASSGEVGPQTSGINMAHQEGTISQSPYFPQQSSFQTPYAPASHPTATAQFSNQMNPQFSPDSSTSTPASGNSQMSMLLGPYNRKIRHTLECLKQERLTDAATGLLEMSHELLRNVERFELVFDDVTKKESRLKLWHNFNNSWLAVLTKQKDDSDDVLAAYDGGSGASVPQRDLISSDILQKLGDDLLNLCNGIDEWGLVDYEMGVWEEQIIDLLVPCQENMKRIDRARTGRDTSNKPRSSSAETAPEDGQRSRPRASPLRQTVGERRR